MPLPGSGPISLRQVNEELGRPSSQIISLQDSQVRALAGVPSGAIGMSSLRGKSFVTFTPDGGPSSSNRVELIADNLIGNGAISIYCSQLAVWNWSRVGGGGYASQSVSNGGSNTIFTANLVNPTIQTLTAIWSISATAGGVTKFWLLTLTDYGINP